MMVSLADIDPERSDLVKRVMSAILRINAVTHAFAQAIDGLPIESMYESTITMRTDLLSRTEPSDQAIMLSKQFCGNPEEILRCLSLNPTVAQQYQNCPLFSHSFNMHLLELVAISVHDIAGNLYATSHPNGEPEPAQASSFPPVRSKDCISLSTKLYIASDWYPRGFLDVVGYWAEIHIFGGVVVFDRGPQEEARNCYGAYIHPRYPEKLFQLSEFQLQKLNRLGFEEESLTEGFALPFVCEPNAKTVHHVTAFQDLNISRDRYERRILPARGGRCPVIRLEYHPEIKEFIKQTNDMFADGRLGYPQNED